MSEPEQYTLLPSPSPFVMAKTLPCPLRHRINESAAIVPANPPAARAAVECITTLSTILNSGNKDIVRGIEKKKDVVYTLWFWWGIMLIINVPQFVFKRVSL